MFSSLPWFIRSEIIKQTIPREHSKYCLLNKEWFTSSAGQFMKLDSVKLSEKPLPSNWFKLTESLIFSWYSFLDWDFLLDCKQIKTVTFRIVNYFEFDVEFESLIEESQFTSAHFHFDTEMCPTDTFCFLDLITPKLQKLMIHGFGTFYPELLNCKYPDLIELFTHTFDGAIFFDDIPQSMPKLQRLAIESDYIDYDLSDSIPFSFLKFLEIFLDYSEEDHGEFTEKLFHCNFPALVSCDLYFPVYKRSLDRIHLSMPKLKKNSSNFPLLEGNELFFPSHPLICLEELELSYHEDSNKNMLLKIDLNLLPQLQKLNAKSNFGIGNFNKDKKSILSLVDNKISSDVTSKDLSDHLSNLNEFDFGFSDHPISFCELLNLFKIMPKLSLNFFSCPDSLATLPSGPFKTTHLKLKGKDFLANELILWLSNQSQLKSLLLNFFNCEKLALNEAPFPYLDNLTIICNSPDKKEYLESTFNCKKLKVSILDFGIPDHFNSSIPGYVEVNSLELEELESGSLGPDSLESGSLGSDSIGSGASSNEFEE